MASQDHLKKLAAYVPEPIAQAICDDPSRIAEAAGRRFPAAVLFTDISGFTTLTELLCEASPTGSEELSQLINKYFTRMIQTIQAYQGQVVKFSGDALTVLFPAKTRSLQTAARLAGECALSLQTRMVDFTALTTSSGPASLSMKVGIGAGSVFECSVGGQLDRWEYVVGGDALVQVAKAERRAEPGEIILSPEAWQEVHPYFAGSADKQQFVSLSKTLKPHPSLPPTELDWSQLNPEQSLLAEKALQGFIPGAIKARLHEPTDWLAELRHMTILFVGIGGFLYESPQAKTQLQQFIHAAQSVIYRYEGSLGKITVDDKGTAMLILFGAPPLAHEDDTVRAVNCALDLQSMAQTQDLRMSIGITADAVFAGPIGAPTRQEYTVIGDAVNVAARLMQYGRAGSIIISEAVKNRTEENFIIEDLGQLSLKGKANALAAYKVTGREGLQLEFVSRYFGQDELLVGRKSEIEQIRHIAARANDQQLQVLLLEGELGLGKSRLVSELVRDWVRQAQTAFGSKINRYIHQAPYQSWQEILADLLGIAPSLPPKEKRQRLTKTINAFKDPSNQPGYWVDRLPLLLELLGLEATQTEFTRSISGELRRNNTFSLVETLLRRQAASKPLLILLEDIHWADELSLALTAHLIKALANTPILLVLTYRPLSAEKLHSLSEIMTYQRTYTLQLDPLSDDESMDLITTLLSKQSLPAEAQAILLQKGQGNPFFLHELARTITDIADQLPDQETAFPAMFNLPGTVRDVVLTRVDRLPETDKFTLKIASVIGSSFERSLLSAVRSQVNANSDLTTQLTKLVNNNLIRPNELAPQSAYIFHNVITQEVLYEGLLLTQRRQLHTAIGEMLEQLFPDEIERLAYHHSRGSDLNKGVHYLKRAAEKARCEYANRTAITYYSEILSCLSQPQADIEHSQNGAASPANSGLISPVYWDVLLERAKLYNLIGLVDEESEDLGTLGLLAEALNDDRRRALAATQWVRFYETRGDYDSGLEMIERAVQLAKAANDEVLTGEALNYWGKLLYLRGNYQTARTYLQDALQIARKYENRQQEADCLYNQSIVAYYQADYEIARSLFLKTVALWRLLGNQSGLGDGLRYLGRVYYNLGRYSEAHDCYKQSLNLHRTIGNWAGEALTRLYLGQLQRCIGNYGQARSLFRTALTMHQSMGDRRGEADSIIQLGFLHCRSGHLTRALALLEQGLVILRELDDLWALADALTYYAWALTESGKLLKARDYLQEALRIERDLKHGRAKAAIMQNIILLGRIALARNDLSLADTCAQHAMSFFKAHGTDGVEHPMMVYLTCYQILRANNKNDQAKLVLSTGQAYIKAQVASLPDDAAQQAFLNNIPEVKLLTALQQNDQPPMRQLQTIVRASS